MDRVRRLLSIFLATFTMAAAFGPAEAQAADCGGLRRPIVFGDLDWESAQVANWIARLVLEAGFGCATDAIPGTVVPIYQGAVRGDVDVIMEVWTDNVPDLWTEAVAAGVVEEVGVAFDDAVQGWFVPRYLVEGDPERGIEAAAPGLRSVFDLDEHKALFRDPERPAMGRFYNCVIGWQCELVNTVKLHAYGLDDDFTNFRSGTGVALAAALEGAYRRGEPWVGYYWGPTWVLGELDLFLLEEPPYDPDCWAAFTALVDAPERATSACAYPTSRAVVALGSRFKDEAPEGVRGFLAAYHGDSGMLSRALAFMHAGDAEPEDAARRFLATEREVWSAWLDPETAERVAAAFGAR
ncbi:MAG TPA: ABC transporter substrate-binding protein [Trueperaceae bacterium]|nr:ABC transporter substrate-binding protein [Trueperaceae bacterium]